MQARLLPRSIRRSALVEEPTPIELDTPRDFERAGTLEAVERAESGPKLYRACIAVWDAADTHGDTFTRGSIDLTIPGKGIPLLVGHERSADPVGQIVELINEDDGCYAMVRFAKTPRGQEVESLVADGIYRGVSFAGVGTTGYERGDGVWVYTSATVHELSVTAFPADAGALFDFVRSARRSEDEPATAAVTAPEPDPFDVGDLEALDAGLDDLADLFGVERSALDDALASITRAESSETPDSAPTVPLVEELAALELLSLL